MAENINSTSNGGLRSLMKSQYKAETFRTELSDKESIGDTSKKRRNLVTLVLCSVFPILILAALAFYQLARALETKNNAQSAKEDTEYLVKMETFVLTLQNEQGYTASFLRFGGTEVQNVGNPSTIWAAREGTDNILGDLRWPRKDVMAEYINTKDKFITYLNTYRKEVEEHKYNEFQSIKFYNSLILSVMYGMNRLIILPEKGNLWPIVDASNLVLVAGEAAMSQTIITRTFSYSCNRTSETFEWFQKLIGESTGSFNAAIVRYPPLKQNYTQQFLNSPLGKSVEETRGIIKSENYTEICRAISLDERKEFNFPWFASAFQHMEYCQRVRMDLTGTLVKELDDVIAEAETEVIIYIIVVVAVAVISILVLYFQVKSVNSLINKVLAFAKDSKKKSQALAAEERKALALLCNIMPKPVAKTMRSGQEVAPAYYASATICYIDIVGFMAIISNLKPVQVTNMFKHLYGMYDSLLELYTVHKIEQTNDVYCVIGGVPDKNSTHASDVANYVIQLMYNVKKFKMVELPDVKIQIRCGVHTGPCAAGIVGHKTIRYSVFGESVKMASRMSRTGEVQRIQISHATREELAKSTRKYEMEERGFIDVFGIGKVRTYFLEGYSTGEKSDDQSGLISTRL